MTPWCGAFLGQGTWLHSTVNPCLLESVSSVLLICTAALVLSFQCRRVILLRQRKYPGSKRIPTAAVAFYVCIICVVAAHAALLIASIVVYIRGTARYPYELFNQSASLLLWLGALVGRLASSPASWAPIPWTAVGLLCVFMATPDRHTPTSMAGLLCRAGFSLWCLYAFHEGASSLQAEIAGR